MRVDLAWLARVHNTSRMLQPRRATGFTFLRRVSVRVYAPLLRVDRANPASEPG